MTEEQQTWAAIGIVALTTGIFLWKLTRKRQQGCGGGCECASAKKPVTR